MKFTSNLLQLTSLFVRHFLNRPTRVLLPFACILLSLNLNAQVTIGSDTPPLSVSVLEIISPTSSHGGLRLPQLNSLQIDELRTEIKAFTNSELIARAKGLVVYNTDINCAMYWNGQTFASLCGSVPANVSVDCAFISIPAIPIGTSLDPSTHYVDISVTATSPGPFSISVAGNGITYSGEGTFVTGSTANPAVQTVRLIGRGTPIEVGSFHLSVINSLNGDQLCTVPTVFSYPTITLLGLGSGIYQPASASSSAGTSNTFLTGSPNSFGSLSTSKVRIAGFHLVDGGNSPSLTSLKNLIANNKPDIIYIGYSYYPSTANEVEVLKDYVVQGGVLIHTSQNASSYTIPNSIFGTTLFAASDIGSSYLHVIKDPTPGAESNDPIFHGPFSEVNGMVGKKWAEDVSDGWSFSSYPASDPNLIIYSTHPDNSARPSCIRHKTLGYMYIGDAGFVAGNYTDASTTTFPFKLDSTTKLPIDKTYSGGVASNSEFFGNIMAWAIKYALDKKSGTAQ